MRPLIFGILLCFFPLFSSAQINTNGLLNTSLSVELEPTLPSPEESFTASLNDYGGEAYGATIDWYYGEQKLDWAFNKRSITLTAPPAGKTAGLKIVLTKPTGSVEVVSKTIAPLYLDIIVEPQTHVPHFFQGRALPSPGSTINATALLSGSTILTGDYLYTWRINNTVIEGGSLRGGNRVSFTMPQDSYSALSLSISSLNGTVLARRTISLPSVAPTLLFYEVSTLYGVIETALKNPFSFIGNSGTFRAEPYYLDSAVFNNPEVVTWRVDGTVAPNGTNPYDITLERTGELRQTELEFRVQSTTKLLQGVKSSLILNVL